MAGNPSVPDMIADLRAGSFRGKGGATALAEALGVGAQSLKAWRAGRTEPSYANRQALIALWRAECEEGNE